MSVKKKIAKTIFDLGDDLIRKGENIFKRQTMDEINKKLLNDPKLLKSIYGNRKIPKDPFKSKQRKDINY